MPWPQPCAAAFCGAWRDLCRAAKGQWPLETLREVTHTKALSRELFTHHFLSLEIAGVLLLIALVAALTLARKQPTAAEVADAAAKAGEGCHVEAGQVECSQCACGNKDQGGAA